MAFHPMQEIVIVDGTARFKENKIVSFLKDNGKYDLNQLRAQFGSLFSVEDWTQFYQQIGYSVSGYGDLSFIPEDIVQKADEIAELVDAGAIEYTDTQPSKTKPDIFIHCNNDDPVSVYSNNPDAIGKIIFHEGLHENYPLEERDLIYPEIIQISGDFNQWKSKFESSPTGLKQFLECFIIRNA